MKRLKIPWQLKVSLAAIAMRFPFYAFLFHFSNRLNLSQFQAVVQNWCAWDCAHYADMSLSYPVTRVAWFPGFPLTIRLFRTFLGSMPARSATLLVSNIFAIIAISLGIVFAAQLRSKNWRESLSMGKDPFPWVVGFTMAIFPWSHFWSSGYSEAFFMACLLGSLIALHYRKIIPAAALIGIAGITRNQGMWMAAMFCVWVCWDQIQMARTGKAAGLRLTRDRAAWAVLFAATPIALFHLWQWVLVGNPFYYVQLLQKGWGRHFSALSILKSHIPRNDVAYVLLVLSWVAGIQLLRRPGHVHRWIGALTLVFAILPLGVGGFGWGYGRYMSTSPGIFLFLGELFVENMIIALPVYGWMIFRLAVEIDRWTRHLWCG